jgi:hypothetical protein
VNDTKLIDFAVGERMYFSSLIVLRAVRLSTLQSTRTVTVIV